MNLQVFLSTVFGALKPNHAVHLSTQEQNARKDGLNQHANVLTVILLFIIHSKYLHSTLYIFFLFFFFNHNKNKRTKTASTNVEERYRHSERRFISKFLRANTEQRANLLRQESIISKFPISVHSRERAMLHEQDSEFQCFGLCLRSGTQQRNVDSFYS